MYSLTLAATGSLVLSSGPGRYLATSSLPPVHVAVLYRDQILPDLESWLSGRRGERFARMRRATVRPSHPFPERIVPGQQPKSLLVTLLPQLSQPNG